MDAKVGGRLTHVQTSCNTSSGQWLIFGILLSRCHETWHFIFGQLDLATTKSGQ